MTAQVTEIDFDARYSVAGYEGIAFYLLGYAQQYEPYTCILQDEDGNEWEEECDEGEMVDDCDHVIAVMVGDDRKYTVAVTDIKILSDEDYCPECGQIGCKAYAE